VIVEDAMFSAAEADALGYAIVQQVAANRLWPGGIRLRSEPLAPWQSEWRLLTDGPRPTAWQVELEPRLELRLRVDRYGLFGDELPDGEGSARLVEARRQIAAFVAQPFPLGDTYVDGTVDVEPEPFAADERWLELPVGVTLFEL
jgi:hypothetical protein